MYHHWVVCTVVPATISNVHVNDTLGEVVAVINYNGLIDGIIEYVCAIIFDAYFANTTGIFGCGINICIRTDIQSSIFEYRVYYNTIVNLSRQSSALVIGFFDEMCCSHSGDATLNGFLYCFNCLFNLGALTVASQQQ